MKMSRKASEGYIAHQKKEGEVSFFSLPLKKIIQILQKDHESKKY